MKTFIIGDIHGCYLELMQLLDAAQVQPDDLLISVGDIVDRGGQSLEVYRFLKERPNTIVLMGNHERKHLRGVLSYAQEIVKVQMGEEYASFLSWLQSLPYWHETEEAIIVHAALEPGVPLHKQREEVLCGSTAGEKHLAKVIPEGDYWSSHHTAIKPVIYGHHVVGDVPKVINATFGIDTGACHGGCLTALELPGFKVHQVKAPKDYWTEQQRVWQLPVLRAKPWDEMEFEEAKQLIHKLGHVQEQDVREFLALRLQALEDDLSDVEGLHAHILLMARQILEQQPDGFTAVASRYSIKPLLFKARAGTLTQEDVRRAIWSPRRLAEVMEEIAHSGLW